MNARQEKEVLFGYGSGYYENGLDLHLRERINEFPSPLPSLSGHPGPTILLKEPLLIAFPNPSDAALPEPPSRLLSMSTILGTTAFFGFKSDKGWLPIVESHKRC